MNKKVVVVVAIVVVALCVLAVIYAPNLMEFVMRIHRIPQH